MVVTPAHKQQIRKAAVQVLKQRRVRKRGESMRYKPTSAVVAGRHVLKGVCGESLPSVLAPVGSTQELARAGASIAELQQAQAAGIRAPGGRWRCRRRVDCLRSCMRGEAAERSTIR